MSAPGSVGDRRGVVVTPPSTTDVPGHTAVESPPPEAVTPTGAPVDELVRDAPPTTGARASTGNGLVESGEGLTLQGTDPTLAGERLYATSRQQAQQIAAEAAALAAAETLAIRGEFEYAQQVLQTAQSNPTNEAARRTLTELNTNIAQLDQLIGDLEQRVTDARALLARPPLEGNAEDGRARAEAMALLASYQAGSDGQLIDTGTPEERLAAAKDARTTLLMVQAGLRSASEPLTAESTLLARIDGRGGEIERLRGLVEATPADDPRRAEYLAVLEALQGTAQQIRGRWGAAHASLAGVEQSLGLRAGRDQGAGNLVTRIAALETQLGITVPESDRGPRDVAAVQRRMATVIQAQHQQAALVVEMLRSDAGMTDAQLISSGLLQRTPEEAVRRIKAENPALAREFGLADADPARLTPQELQIGTMLALNTDAATVGRGLDRLYSAWRIDPSTRNRSQDLISLARLARTGQVDAQGGQSLPAVRQNFLVGRQVASGDELRAMHHYLSTRRDTRSLAEIAADNRVPREIRLTADKLYANTAMRAAISNPSRDAGTSPGRIDLGALAAMADRIGGYEYPGAEGARYRGKVFLENFYDPARLDRDVDRLFHAMKGMGTDERTIFDVLGPRQPDERHAIVTEYARRMRAEGYKGDDACPAALYHWLRSELSGWEYGRAMSLMDQRRTGAEWATELRTRPSEIIDNPGDPRRATLRTPEGRLDWQRQYFNIFRQPYNVRDMGDRESVSRWQGLDATAARSLRAYEAAVQSGDATRIRAAEAAFTRDAGEAIAQYKLLTETYSTQLDERVRRLQQIEEGVIIGGVVVAATAATIATAGAASAAGFTAVAAVATGFAAGTAAGTAVGFGLRVTQEASHTGGLGNMNWSRIGERTFGDFKIAAGSAIAAAIPTVGFARLQQAAWFVGRGAQVGQAVAHTATAAQTVQRVALTARLVSIGKNAAAGAVFNTAGSFGMRGVHWAANTIAGVEQPASPDLDFSLTNLLLEVGSGAVSGAANPLLANLTHTGRARSILLRATARGSGFVFDMGMNAADESLRNVAYGRDPTDGLTQALLVGAPANVAGGLAGRRAAFQAQERSQRAQIVLGDTGQLRSFVDFAQGNPGLRRQLLTPDGQLNPAARLADFELAVAAWDRARPASTTAPGPTTTVDDGPTVRPASDEPTGPTAGELANTVRDTDFGRRVEGGELPAAQLELMRLSSELTRHRGISWADQRAELHRLGIDVDNPHGLRALADGNQLLAAFGALRALGDVTPSTGGRRTRVEDGDASLGRLRELDAEVSRRPLAAEGLADARRTVAELLATPEARTPEGLRRIEAAAPHLMQQLRLSMVHADGPRVGYVNADGRIVLHDVTPANARAVMTEIKTADATVRGDSYELRTAVLTRSGGQVDSATAYTYAVDLAAAGGKRYLDNPESWLPQRRAFHEQVLNDALAQARALSDVLHTDQPTVYALRGNTAVGKTRSLSGVPELAGAVGHLKAHPNAAINPDNFKLDIINRPGESMTHMQAHAESSYLSRRMTATIEAENRTRLIDRRLGEVGDISEIFASADRGTPPLPVKLYDIDAGLEISLVGVLTRRPGGSDPIPPFSAIAGGFVDARANRARIVEMFVERGGGNRMEIFATDADQSKHLVARVENGSFEVLDRSRAEHLFEDPRVLVESLRTQVIDDAFIARMADPMGDNPFANVIRDSLGRYRGMTLEQALTAHGQARPE